MTQQAPAALYEELRGPDRADAAERLDLSIDRAPATAEAAVESNAVLPLLAMAQQLKRKEDLSPEPGQDALLVREADNALIALGRMCMRGMEILKARGWEVANDE